MLNRRLFRLFGAIVLVIGILARSPQAAQAAERCPVKVESIEEDRAMAGTRPIWTARLFSVTMLANTILPGTVRIRAYTLGHVFHGQVRTLRWFPTEATSIFRSAPVVLAFPDEELLLHLGVTGLNARGGLGQDCAIRLRAAYSSLPNLSLAPLDPRGAVLMQPTQTLHSASLPQGGHRACPPKPARIARHVDSTIRPSPEAPVDGGPYVGLVGVHVGPDGSVRGTFIEVSSGLSWFDAQIQEGARRQIYTPATLDCRPVAGTYYFSGQFETEDEGDLRRAF